MADSGASKLTPAQRRAYRWGSIVAALVLIALIAPGTERWHQAGPGNTGHEEIECETCHTDAPGNPVGQVLANVGYWLGIGEAPAHFVFAPAGNEQCLECHENDEDRHPVARFLEPEFATARAAIAPQFCVSCHLQHRGVRLTQQPDFCRHCHGDTTVDEDPVDVPHATLIADQRWETCLGCHDFHGNHEHETPTVLAERFTAESVRDYFDGGTSIYGHRRLTVMQTMRTGEKEREDGQ